MLHVQHLRNLQSYETGIGDSSPLLAINLPDLKIHPTASNLKEPDPQY